mmetsp:Transcript_107925/g.168676  ORF Transcript_107925/g.168676 Transcript_107925/m.168676 type:complete len:712 (-) Transcript_107925:23-2158(-)
MDPFQAHGTRERNPALDPALTTYTQHSRIYNQPMDNLKPGPKHEWYVSTNNWKECEHDMFVKSNDIHKHFDGSISTQERRIKADALQKAADQLYLESNGKLGRKWTPEVKMVETVNLFEDHWFPGRNDSWYRGFGAETVEDYIQPVKWKRLWDTSPGVPYTRIDSESGMLRPPPQPIYQGALENFYLVQACYAISMKAELIRNIFANMEYSSPECGYYVLRFYKHAQWICVPIDDFLPYDKYDAPMCIRGDLFPALPWPSLVEKAYAKLHGSWSSISGGGSVEEVMTDLTGGCSGRFHTGDCAGDRMWKYFDELKTITVWGVEINERECSKRLIPIAKHWAAGIWETCMHQGVPYIGVFTSAPAMSVKHFPMCDLPDSITGDPGGPGLIWLRMDDFTQLFDAIYECRLVTSDLRSLTNPDAARDVVPRHLPGGSQLVSRMQSSQYAQFSPAYSTDETPWYEKMWAFRGEVVCENAPTFVIQVREPGTELVMDAQSTDQRHSHSLDIPDTSRHLQAPLLLRFFQVSDEVEFRPKPGATNGHLELVNGQGGEIYMVHMSAWAHTRDAMCCVKVLAPGNYVAMVSMPSKFCCEKMIFRTYSSKRHVFVGYLEAHKQLMAVNPGKPLAAIPYSLTGIPRIDEYSERLPRMFDEDEGKGKNLARPWQEVVRGDIERAIGRNPDENFGMKTVGYFGGANAEPSTLASEVQAEKCSLM